MMDRQDEGRQINIVFSWQSHLKPVYVKKPTDRAGQLSSAVSLTIGITYSQLGRILHILYDSNTFDFPQLSISVLLRTVTFHVALKGNTHQANINP